MPTKTLEEAQAIVVAEAQSYGFESFEEALEAARKNEDWNLLRTMATVHFNRSYFGALDLINQRTILAYYLYSTVEVDIGTVIAAFQKAMKAGIAATQLGNRLKKLPEEKPVDNQLEIHTSQEEMIPLAHCGGYHFIQNFLDGKQHGTQIEEWDTTTDEPKKTKRYGLWFTPNTYNGDIHYLRNALENLDQPVCLCAEAEKSHLVMPRNDGYEHCLPEEYRGQLKVKKMLFYVFEPEKVIDLLIGDSNSFIESNQLPRKTNPNHKKILSLSADKGNIFIYTKRGIQGLPMTPVIPLDNQKSSCFLLNLLANPATLPVFLIAAAAVCLALGIFGPIGIGISLVTMAAGIGIGSYRFFNRQGNHDNHKQDNALIGIEP